MYKCSLTGKTTKLGEKLNKVVVESREKVYSKKVFNEETRQVETLQIGTGWEIVKEIQVSEEGLNLWNSWSPEQKAAWKKS